MNKNVLLNGHQKMLNSLSYVSKRFKDKRQFTIMKENFELVYKLIPDSYIIGI